MIYAIFRLTFFQKSNFAGISGAQIIAIPLKRNKTLKELKICENSLKSQGCQFILASGINLQMLHLGHNFIKSSSSPILQAYLIHCKTIRSLNLQYNEIQADGCGPLWKGILNSELHDLSIKGNNLYDSGVHQIAQILQNVQKFDYLKYLNLANNQLTHECIPSLIVILDRLQLQTLILSKNYFGDEGLIALVSGDDAELTDLKSFSKSRHHDLLKNKNSQPKIISVLSETATSQTLQKIDLSACKLSDPSLLRLLETLPLLPMLQNIKFIDNFISEKYQKLILEHVILNPQLTQFALSGNRLSLSGLKKIKVAIQKNMYAKEQQQPLKLRSEIANLKERQKRAAQIENLIRNLQEELKKLERQRNSLLEAINTVENDTKIKVAALQSQIIAKKAQIEQTMKNISIDSNSLITDSGLQTVEIQSAQKELKNLKTKKKQLQYQYQVTKNEAQLLQTEFKKKTTKSKK